MGDILDQLDTREAKVLVVFQTKAVMTYACVYVCMYMCVCLCVHVHVCVCLCVYVHVCVFLLRIFKNYFFSS